MGGLAAVAVLAAISAVHTSLLPQRFTHPSKAAYAMLMAPDQHVKFQVVRSHRHVQAFATELI